MLADPDGFALPEGAVPAGARLSVLDPDGDASFDAQVIWDTASSAETMAATPHLVHADPGRRRGGDRARHHRPRFSS